ncbi:acyl-CoA dehydrogenase family protein [Chromobacterium subtsugae]|uniref:Acyl-CoA dehydrogenase family protein n=1 Tax=Chromobacterium subtsugae TaxID=251747 RepID=A0ABS7F8H3_9NEIS|nr:MULTISPECIES: acyl-CoA dehydrogenase family protein [Chromobacterium]MBW7565205.1 acyl-CoA dehydrogenase family protein [Chromobacterium subtsugae]MBW8286267.1 acyl-CoA dehydrogenase family protein [Chromobacterium subtsugae]WSE91682.1 acyl-CoA dehydrogenase family protein [Chromobacterium subtsugae]WVH60057.1 acyl-CoA dehydrogenase family protein [Chromobacterium subtsugae]
MAYLEKENMGQAAADEWTAERILSRARELAPVLRQRAAEIEQNRHLPADVVELLRGTGVFRMAMPKSWGGPELDSMQQTEVIEALAIGDASAGWCGMIGADSGIYSGYLREETAREMFPRLDMITAGWIHPEGRAERVAGGYRVTGNWRFGSGSTHCDWLAAGCAVYQDGEPVLAENGKPEWRIMYARPDEYQIRDTWHTTGLAGSGSRDYAAVDLFVPEERSFSFREPRREGPLHIAPDAILRKMSGVPLGVARAAIDHVRELAASRFDRVTQLPWPQSYRIQTALAQSEMELHAARSGVFASLERQWEKLSAGQPLSTGERVSAALARHHAFGTARAIVARLFDTVGGAAIYRASSPLDRWLRDTNTMCQHAVAQDMILQTCGELMLGGQPDNPFL